MRFTFDQRFAAAPDAVSRAFADPDLYRAFAGLPKMTAPEVLAHSQDGDVVSLQIRYRFDGELSAAARAVIDPARLTWVEHAEHDLATRTTTFRMVPDHYGDRFRCSGSYRFRGTDEGTLRQCEGDVKVRALLVAGAVEQAIISGLKEHLHDEVPVVEAFIAG